ncbi:hypothetical protein K9L97_05080 [Candidatus Woesearchaeota archaeon]|nr:hypothetical protein [Candidatus Woesearchaeota archaeon]
MSQTKLAENKQNIKKKTAKRKTKKASSKKTKNSEKTLVDAPEEKYFVMCNGHHVKNPLELADALEHIRDEVFEHHVNDAKNDFATWIHDVFEDVQLAKELGNEKNKNNTRIVLYKHIVRRLKK